MRPGTSDRDDDLRHEIEFHLAEEAAERESEGVAADQARAAARREFGNTSLVMEDARSHWAWLTLESIVIDCRFAALSLRRQRTFAATVLLTFSLTLAPLMAILGLANNVRIGVRSSTLL